MDMCQKCISLMKKNKDWHQIDFTRVAQSACQTHPVITNRRVIRTLKSIKAWSLEPAGMTQRGGGLNRDGTVWAATLKINVGGGHVPERNVRLILFDYEKPFIDLLVKEGYLARHRGVRTIEETTPTTLTVTKAGDDLIRQSLLLAEVKNDKSPLTP